MRIYVNALSICDNPIIEDIEPQGEQAFNQNKEFYSVLDPIEKVWFANVLLHNTLVNNFEIDWSFSDKLPFGLVEVLNNIPVLTDL